MGILEHKSIHDVKKGSGAEHLKQVQSHLMGLGIAPRELANLQRIVLRELGCTKAQAVQMQEQELHQDLASANAARTLAEPDAPSLAQRLKDEAIEQALAAGVPQMRVIAATARADADVPVDGRQEARQEARPTGGMTYNL